MSLKVVLFVHIFLFLWKCENPSCLYLPHTKKLSMIHLRNKYNFFSFPSYSFTIFPKAFFNILFSKSSFRFVMRLKEGSELSPYNLCPHICLSISLTRMSVVFFKQKMNLFWYIIITQRPTRPFRTNTQKRCLFHYRGLECKSRKSRNTWSNRQIWPWDREWSRAKTNRVLPRERTGHSKHPLPTTQEKTLHVDITRWSTSKSDWLYSLQPKMEKL